MLVPAGRTFTAILAGRPDTQELQMGARIEVPVTRAIVGYWRPARRDGGIWSVELQAPPRAAQGGEASPGLAQALADGAFQIVWMPPSARPQVEIFTPLWTSAGAGEGAIAGGPGYEVSEDALPTPEDLAVMLRARTKDPDGRELGEWSDDTRPARAQVERLIVLAADQVAGELQARVPLSLVDDFSTCIRLLTACHIEQGYYPEQIAAGQSAREQWWQEYEREVTALKEEATSRQAMALRLV